MFLILCSIIFVSVSFADKLSDYCKILNVGPDAEEAEIHRAFRIKAKKYHPDMRPADPKEAALKMNELVQARDFLLGHNVDRNDREADKRYAELFLRKWTKDHEELLQWIDERRNKSEEFFATHPRPSNVTNENDQEEKNETSTIYDDDAAEVEDVFVEEESEEMQKDQISDIGEIETLKNEIECRLDKLDFLDIDIQMYLLELHDTFCEEPMSVDNLPRAQKVLIMFVWFVVVIAMGYLTQKESDEERAKHETRMLIRQLFGHKTIWEISINDLRDVIRNNQSVLGHIKTSGKGRTKANILSELEQF
eukprot:176048_1